MKTKLIADKFLITDIEMQLTDVCKDNFPDISVLGYVVVISSNFFLFVIDISSVVLISASEVTFISSNCCNQ